MMPTNRIPERRKYGSIVSHYLWEHKMDHWGEIPDDAPEEVLEARRILKEIYEEDKINAKALGMDF